LPHKIKNKVYSCSVIIALGSVDLSRLNPQRSTPLNLQIKKGCAIAHPYINSDLDYRPFLMISCANSSAIKCVDFCSFSLRAKISVNVLKIPSTCLLDAAAL